MVKLTIDEKEILVEEGTTLLEAAKKLGIDIPTLCYHQAIKPYGACRVCLVEIISGAKPELTSSCSYPVSNGLVVRTDSERVTKARRLVVELLLARSPDSEKIKVLAQKMSINKPRFKIYDEKCILCGLCVRLCKEIIQRSAIGFVNRGKERKVETPFEEESDVCLGCGACVFICPTGAIELEDLEDKRFLSTWHSKFSLKKCNRCGKYFVPEVVLDFLKEKVELTEDIFSLCADCRRRVLREKIEEIKVKVGG
jgi:NADH dehydrogenase/NADH:ubiquinone oxidoreductase subunit G